MRLLAVFPFLVFGLSLGAAQLPDARQLLAHSDDPLFTSRTSRLQFELTIEVSLSGVQSKVLASELLEIADGNRFRYSARVGENDVLVVSNGTTVWRYSPKDKTYTVGAFQMDSLRQLVDNIVYGRALANIRSAAVQRQESIDVKGNKINCYVIRAEYPRMPGFPNSSAAIRTVWVDVDRNLVWRDTWESQVPVPNAASVSQVRTDHLYSLLEFDKELSADLFSFHPPEGSVQTTSSAPKVVLPPHVPGLGDPLASMQKSSSGSDVTGDVFRVGGGISQPSVIYKVDPEYSEEARKARHSGTVVLSVIVDTEGKARDIRVIKNLGMGLDEKAVEAVQKWKFRPAMKGATPVNVRATIEVNFRLSAPAWVISRVNFEPAAGTRAASLSSPKGTPWDRTCSQLGTVTLGLTVGIDGRPANPKVLRTTNAAANESALATIMTFQFNPALQDGKAVPSDGEVDLSCADRYVGLPIPPPPPPPNPRR